MHARASNPGLAHIQLPAVRQSAARAFTLVELLAVVAIVALLVGVAVPWLSRAKTLARITTAHGELRGLTVAMALYREENAQRIPPTRFSCSSRTAYELPVELAAYLPQGKANGVDVVRMPDPFTPEASYKYRAVGTAIVNESTILPRAATLWVPYGFPHADGDAGRYHNDPETSPVRYAVWSMGPDPAAPEFDAPGRLPIPPRYWLVSASDTGVIVHFEDAQGHVHASP
jgi:prepilin-type N-terminal cleavage/methylation domain-containing protein